MNLSDVAIRRPVFTAMLSFVLIVLGLLSLGRLGTELYPPVNFPFLTVLTVYPGAGPEDIERDVTKPLEDAVSSISGLDDVRSFTRSDSMFMVLKFGMGTDVETATNAVRDKIGGVKGKLPDGAEDPVIQQLDIGALPVLVAVVSTPAGVNETREKVDERLRPLLEQIEGVGAVNVLGGQDREIHVNLDLDRLRALGVSPSQVAQRLGIENLSVPVGDMRLGSYSVGVRAEAQFEHIDDLRSMIVHQTRDGQQVRLGDVATVVDDFTKASRYVRFNGQEAVAVEVVKKSGANTVAVCEAVRAKLESEVPKLADGAVSEVITDQSLEVKANAHEVWIAIYFGGAMAVLVILFFLLDLRGTFISALALPTSIIGTFAVMYYLGFSLNMMTLLGLSLAIGLLIDDAVVVRESITRRLEAGDSPAEAASRGTREIALAVLATTLSLVAVFVPVAFMSGIVGQFFKQFGLTIAVAVMLSLFVAFTLDPMLSARLSKAHDAHAPEPRLVAAIRGFLDRVDDRYRDVLRAALRWPKLTVGASVGMLLVTGVVAAILPKEFVPKEDRGEIFADVRLPVGSALEVTSAAVRAAEAKLMATPGVERVYTIIGHENSPERARVRVRVTDKANRVEPLERFEERVRATLSEVPQATVNLSQPAIIDGLGDFPPIILILQGPDLEGLAREGERLEAMLKAQPDATDVRMSLSPGRPELRLSVDRAAAADRGVPAGLVGVTARMMVEGELVGSLRDGGEEADIRLRADPRFAEDARAIAALPLPSPRGDVQLGDVAQVTMDVAAAEIQRYNRMRSVNITAQVAPGGNLGGLVETFFKDLERSPLPEGYFLTLDGQAKDMEDTFNAMGLAIGVAFLFIFMVLASQFESLIHPFTLMVSVPLAMVGAILALAMTGNSISMGSLIGIILLMGLVTKNAILLVDGAIAAMREGMSPVEALELAGPRRLRPIVMTSAAMALGMIPTAVASGIGSEFRAPMAIAVIGGVISSTVLTLVVVPVIFLWMERLRSFFVRGPAPITEPTPQPAK